MGCAFSFLTSSVRSRTNELVPNVNALSNDENVDKQQNESENCIRTQGSVCFSDSDLNSADQNRDQVLKGKPAIESVNGATYNLPIQIRDSLKYWVCLQMLRWRAYFGVKGRKGRS